MNFTTRYNYEPPKGLVNDEESKTFQECKDDCDINIMYKRYLSKGFDPPNIKALEARYGDISSAQSYEEMLNVQEDVKTLFNELPSDIREECDYNVDNFINLISSVYEDEKIQELQKDVLNRLGMVERAETIRGQEIALTEAKIPEVELPHQKTIDEGIVELEK